MAERRMFTKKITESDAFLDMPSSSQMLYFHLSMSADDDGFVNNPKKIQRMCGASDDDFKLLIAKSFIISFDSGVIVIKHWKMHNYIQSDRYRPTDYVDEKAMLRLKENKAYTLDKSQMDTECIQTVSVGKDSIGKYSIDNNININNNITNSINNNKNNNQENKVYINIINYLNTKCNTKYKYNTPNTIKHINARIRDGYTEQDFFTVIDKKADEWIGTEQEKYLRPDTLFGSKFESYLNQRVTKKTQIDEWGAFLDDKE